VRTFACDPGGRLLVAASIKPHAVLDEGGARPVPAALSVFRIEPQGTLRFVRQYEVETAPGQMQYWMGMVAIAGG
jgi:6-phosphogluconolactonase